MLSKNPKYIHLNLLLLTVVSNHLRLDRGSETGHMATIHSFIMKDVAKDLSINGEDTVHYGTSTNNKVFTMYCIFMNKTITRTVS